MLVHSYLADLLKVTSTYVSPFATSPGYKRLVGGLALLVNNLAALEHPVAVLGALRKHGPPLEVVFRAQLG